MSASARAAFPRSWTSRLGTWQLRPPELSRVVPAFFILNALAGAVMLIAKAAGAPLSGGEIVIVLLRLVVPLLILRFWLAGGVVAMLLDASDVILIEVIGLGGFGDHYAELDKLLDLYYYVLELWVALTWANPWTRAPALALFAYRVVGVALFELVHARIMLFIFPNMFENWWLYCVVVMKWVPSWVPHDRKSVAVPMMVLLVPKMAQEYLLHFAEAKPWEWTKEHILEPIGISP